MNEATLPVSNIIQRMIKERHNAKVRIYAEALFTQHYLNNGDSQLAYQRKVEYLNANLK